MKKLAKYIFFISLAGFYPIIVLASQSGGSCRLGTDSTTTTFQVLVSFIICNINLAVIPLIFALAVVMFIWGVVRFVLNNSDEAKKEQGRQFMLWGVIALTVMLCVWGIVSVLANTFGVNVKVIPQVTAPAPK